MMERRYAKAQVSGNGMVAAAHPLAALAGIDALREGGNAMDACLVMASVTSVVLPHMCGLGGDAFFIYYDAGTKTVTALNGSGAPGDNSTLEFFAGTGPILPQDGIFSVAVPGAPLVFEMAARRFGTFGLRKCFDMGARVAERGFVVSTAFSRAVQAEKAKLSKFEESSRVFLPGGEPPKPGTLFRQVDMANTLRAFGEGGAEYMYEGPFAEKFYEMSEEMGGTFTGGEFKRHLQSPLDFYEPIQTSYRGYTVLQTAPVTPGFIVLEELNILETLDMAALSPAGPQAIHFMVEAKKIAFADRNAHAGDPAVTGFDVSAFISKDCARAAAKTIDLEKASVYAGHDPTGGDTTSFVAWDAKGNCCSFIHSNAFAFGSGVMVPGTGVLLNNRAGRSFVLEPGHPNCLAPGKRPMHTLNCYMVLHDGHPFIVGGTPGGDGQLQWNMQMLSLVLDHGMGPQESCDFPRWTSSPGTDVIGLGKPYELRLESRFPEETVKDLLSMGHAVKTVGPWAGGGGAQIIMKDYETGALIGGSDKRVGGMALGY
jgi:gamma-glutamyltranspeptidase/glutathione hydrolase